MKDELTKDQWLAKQDQEFNEIRLSKCCHAKIEGSLKRFCTECHKETLGVYKVIYQCSLCLEEHEDEECNCYA